MLLKSVKIFCLLVCIWSTSVKAQDLVPDELKPEEVDWNRFSNIYKDMGIIQRKAFKKAGKFVFATHGAFDFSDGPKTMYGIHFNPGYAFNDFFEVYVSASPFFISNDRSIVEKVEANGFEINFAKPKSMYGLEILWAPLYGKDSLGLRNLVRSDTFLKIGYMRIMYEGGQGNNFQMALGKTFFINSFMGLRISLAGNYRQVIFEGERSYSFMGVLESGLSFYL